MIRLESLVMKNFCQHRYFKQKFGAGVMGLTGDLGSGKSNALYAIRATLTDDFRALGTKESCINWDCPKKASSYIEADWNLHGTEITIKRSLRPAESVLTYKATGEVVDGKAKVSEALCRLVGIDERVLVNYVFVEQWQTFAFLSQQPAERAKLFSHLCGTEELAVIHKALSEFVAQDSQLAPEIDEAEEKRLKLENKRLTEYEKDLQKKYFKTKLAAGKLQFDKVQKAYAAILRAGVISLQIGELQPRLDVAKKRVMEIAGQVEAYEKLTQVGYKRREIAHEAISRLWVMYHERYPTTPKEIMKRYKAGEFDVESLLDIQVPVEDLTEQEKVVMDFLVQHRAWQHKLGQVKLGNSECPTCGTKLQYDEVDVYKAKKKVKFFKEHYDRSAAIVAKHKDLAERIERWNAERAQFKLDLKHNTEHPNYPGGPSRDDVRKAEKRKEQYGSKLDKKEKLEALLLDKVSLVKRLTQEEREKSMSLEELMNEVKELNCGKDEPEIKDNLEQAARRDERLKGFQDGLAQVREALQEIKTQQARLRGVRQKADNAVKWLEDAEYIRDIMHHTALPRDIAVSRLHALTKPINRTLNQFGMDFVVKPDESLSFLVKLGSGAETSASRLSGGQKMLLAISFWLAINSVFVSDVGFLTLDEPTAGLNRESIQSLAEVIGVFSKSAKQAGRQVIVVTHENALRKVFDQCIELPPV